MASIHSLLPDARPLGEYLAQLLAPRAPIGLVRGDDPEDYVRLLRETLVSDDGADRELPADALELHRAATMPELVGRLARALVGDGRAGANVLTASLRARRAASAGGGALADGLEGVEAVAPNAALAEVRERARARTFSPSRSLPVRNILFSSR